MKSDLPKVLVPANGRPLVDYVLDALEAAGIEQSIVVVGYRGDDVRRALQKGEKIYINARTIITPAARDMGEPAEVFAKV